MAWHDRTFLTRHGTLVGAGAALAASVVPMSPLAAGAPAATAAAISPADALERLKQGNGALRFGCERAERFLAGERRIG
jgi:hypothetical protein